MSAPSRHDSAPITHPHWYGAQTRTWSVRLRTRLYEAASQIAALRACAPCQRPAARRRMLAVSARPVGIVGRTDTLRDTCTLRSQFPSSSTFLPPRSPRRLLLILPQQITSFGLLERLAREQSTRLRRQRRGAPCAAMVSRPTSISMSRRRRATTWLFGWMCMRRAQVVSVRHILSRQRH